MAIDSVAGIAISYGVPVPEEVTDNLKKAADHLIDGRHRDAVKEPAKVIIEEKIQQLYLLKFNLLLKRKL
jgi:hypothetical protein